MRGGSSHVRRACGWFQPGRRVFVLRLDGRVVHLVDPLLSQVGPHARAPLIDNALASRGLLQQPSAHVLQGMGQLGQLQRAREP